jgi:C-terminal processing protease CtpA/Prc
MLHAMADFHTPDGTRLEGRGVVPDETVLVRREDLLAGVDAQLEAALNWLVSQDDEHNTDQ